MRIITVWTESGPPVRHRINLAMSSILVSKVLGEVGNLAGQIDKREELLRINRPAAHEVAIDGIRKQRLILRPVIVHPRPEKPDQAGECPSRQSCSLTSIKSQASSFTGTRMSTRQ